MPINVHIADHPPAGSRWDRTRSARRFQASTSPRRTFLLRRVALDARPPAGRPENQVHLLPPQQPGHDTAALAKVLDRYPNMFITSPPAITKSAPAAHRARLPDALSGPRAVRHRHGLEKQMYEAGGAAGERRRVPARRIWWRYTGSNCPTPAQEPVPDNALRLLNWTKP